MNGSEDLDVLDDLIQVIYQTPERFILLSTVDDDKWKLQLALVSSAGGSSSWWRAQWKETHLSSVASGKSSPPLQELPMAIAKSIRRGELAVTEYADDKSEQEVKLVISPDGLESIVIPMAALSREAALDAATEFAFTIGVQAQSRECRVSVPITTSILVRQSSTPLERTEVKRPRIESPMPERMGGDKQPPPAKIAPAITAKKTVVSTKGIGASRSGGTSKAIPIRAKRVAKKMEFESDEE